MADEEKLYKPRKSHKKSRNGCKNCRRRKIKCDETKPECRTCVIREEQCEYFPHTIRQESQFQNLTITSVHDGRRMQSILTTNSPSLHGQPTWTSVSPEADETLYDASEALNPYSPSDVNEEDMYLFTHYIRHTVHAPGLTNSFRYARKVAMPRMAARSQGLLCSILAFGAACICVDILTGYEPLSHMDRIDVLLSRGDYYHGKALAHMRAQLNTDSAQELEIAHAHSAMMLGYPPARRRIFRLLHRQQEKLGFVLHDPMADSPTNLEWLHLLRGVRSIGTIRNSRSPAMDTASPHPERGAPSPYISAYILNAVESQGDKLTMDASALDSPAGPRHVMYPTIAATADPAFQALHQRLNALQDKLRHQDRADPLFTFEQAESQFSDVQALGACYSALTMLEALSHSIFHTDNSTSSSPFPSRDDASPSQATTKPTFSSWLKQYCDSPPTFESSRPLTHAVLTWPNRVPAPYISLLSKPFPAAGFPPHGPPDGGIVANEEEEQPPLLEHAIQYLAWEVYAHWLVFTILIEHEAWWLADLGSSDIGKLQVMLPWTGARGEVDGTGNEEEEKACWWPARMKALAEGMARKGI